jgi:two-component system chemotaxis response regulator CheY
MMKPTSGLELFRMMRSDREMREIPFIMLTASFSHEHVILAKKAGLKHYLLKPFRLDAMQHKLIEVLAPYHVAD